MLQLSVFDPLSAVSEALIVELPLSSLGLLVSELSNRFSILLLSGIGSLLGASLIVFFFFSFSSRFLIFLGADFMGCSTTLIVV